MVKDMTDIDLDGFGVAVAGMTGLDSPKSQATKKPAKSELSAEQKQELDAGIERGSEAGFGVPVYLPEGFEI